MDETDKVVIDFKKLKYKFLFYDFKFIKIKPYLDQYDIGVINAECVKCFIDLRPLSTTIESENFDRYQLFPQVKMAFDTFVVSLCTNLDINRVGIGNMISSKVIRKIAKRIYNYDEVWNMVLESIRLKNAYMSMAIIGTAMPTSDDLNKNLQEMKTMVAELNKKDPKLVSDITKMSVDTIMRQKKQKESSENKIKVEEEKPKL